MAPPKKDPDASKVALRTCEFDGQTSTFVRIFSIFGIRGWCHFFISEVSQLKGEFFKSKGIQFDLHREIPLTIHYWVVGYANSNTPWVATHQVDLHVTYVPLSAPVNFSNARMGGRSWVVRESHDVWSFWSKDNWQLEQIVAIFSCSKEFLFFCKCFFCWMLTTFDEPTEPLQDDLLYRGE